MTWGGMGMAGNSPDYRMHGFQWGQPQDSCLLGSQGAGTLKQLLALHEMPSKPGEQPSAKKYGKLSSPLTLKINIDIGHC